MQITIPNLARWQSEGLKQISGFEKRIVDARKKVAFELTKSLLENIPVWSGRTARSVQATNTGAPKSIEPHPDRGDTSSEGVFRMHQEFGATSQMELGSEPRRGSAEAEAIGSLGSVDYGLNKTLYITIGSTAWGLVERGAAPTPEGARNVAVVSEIAMSQVKGMFPFLK